MYVTFSYVVQKRRYLEKCDHVNHSTEVNLCGNQRSKEYLLLCLSEEKGHTDLETN